MKKIKIIPIKWTHEQHDTDRDGVPNFLDCVWYDPNRQDLKQKIKKFARDFRTVEPEVSLTKKEEKQRRIEREKTRPKCPECGGILKKVISKYNSSGTDWGCISCGNFYKMPSELKDDFDE